MWLVFSVLGLALGTQSGALAGAFLGGFVGYLLTRQMRLEDRLRGIEQHLLTMEGRPAGLPASETVQEAPPASEITESEPEPEFEPGLEPHAESAAWAVPVEPDDTTVTHPTLPDVPGLLTRLLSGNLLAKLGMVLLFFGIASALKLAIDYGVLPPGLRLATATLVGLAAIWAGAAQPGRLFRFAPDSETARRGFAFALEGGGFGILYITTWFAMQQYGYLSATAAFVLFAGLGLSCLAMAVRQDSQGFALLGLVGAFLAPAMVQSQGNHVVLFAYIVLLDVCILGASLLRAWRMLVSLSLAASVALGLAWATGCYFVELRPDVEVLLLALFMLYSAAPWLAARIGPPAQWGWQSATLLFTPPTLAAGIQFALYHSDSDFLAASSLAAGLWYGLLQYLSRPTGDRLLRQAQAGLALTFLSLAPYLAFSRSVSGLFWALEGGALVWYASRTRLRLPAAAGILLQLLSGLLVADLWQRGPDATPFLDSAFHGSLLLVAAGALSTWALRERQIWHRLFLAWTLAWWFGLFALELERSLDGPTIRSLLLALATATAFVLEWGGRRFSLPDLRAASALLLPAAGLALLAAWFDAGHPLAYRLWLVFPLAFGVHLSGLRRQEEDGLDWQSALRHVAGYWLAAWALAWEVFWLASTSLPWYGEALPEALRALVLGGALWLVLRLGGRWPFAGQQALYLGPALALPAALAWFWLFSAATPLDGGWVLPYFPLLNPLDAAALFLLWTLYAHWQAAGRFWLGYGYPALFGLAPLLWLSLILARSVHHFSGVPFLPDTLWHSALLQALLSLAWTGYALLAMIGASRRQVRIAWFAGLGLLLLVCVKLVVVDLANVSGLLRVLSLIGVGLLVLGAGYLAPVPPRQDADQSPA